MEDYIKPLPIRDERSAPFFDGLLEGELWLQHCLACDQWMWPVTLRCRHCLSDQLEWKASAGTGTLYSFALVHQIYHPGFADEIPYNVAFVDLDEGVRVTTNIIGTHNDELVIGSRVELATERITQDLALAKFRVVEPMEGQ